MIERVAQTILRYGMFQPGQRVGVAVSGGADSVCLLHVLIELAARWELRLSVLHLDHQLRGEESRQDAAFVRELSERLGLPVHIAQADIARRGDNLEQAARNARRDFFLSFLKTGVLERVALGHTRSDQAETVLFRFLRGSGTAGLAGIRPVTSEGLVRPLLEVTRAEVEKWLEEKKIFFRQDSSNECLTFARNRIRHELLPMLLRDWNPGLPETLATTAEWALAEEAYWSAEMDRLAAALLQVRSGVILLNVNDLVKLPVAVARRLARRAMELVKGDLRGIEFQHIEEVLRLASAAEGSGRFQAPGVDVFRSFDRLRIAQQRVDNLSHRNFRFAAPVPGLVKLPDGAEISLEVLQKKAYTDLLESGYNNWMSALDWDRVQGPLELRNWRPGDQYQPIGQSNAEKVKVLFQRARIPLWERRHWPVITKNDEIVWVRRFGAAAAYAATPDSGSILHICDPYLGPYLDRGGIGSARTGVNI